MSKKIIGVTVGTPMNPARLSPDAVQYVPQELTEEQQMQACKNMGLYFKETVPAESELVYEYKYVGWWECFGTDTISDGIAVGKYVISAGGTNYECEVSANDAGNIPMVGYSGNEFLGNAELLPYTPGETAASYSNPDCPVAFHWEYGAGELLSFNVYIDPEFPKSMGTSIKVYTVTDEMVDKYHTIPDEYIPGGIARKADIPTKTSQIYNDSGFITADDIPQSGGVNVVASVGQTIVVEEVDANGKPTKWSAADYQPRTHWDEEVEILPETTVEIDPEAGMGVIPAEFTVVGGEEYTVKYNGVEYATTCYVIEGQFCLGNIGAVDESLPATEEPFLVAYTEAGEDDNGEPIYGWVVAPLDGSASVTLSIEQRTIKKIEDKYLPDSSIPFRLDVYPDGNSYKTSTTAVELLAAYKAGRAITAYVYTGTETVRKLLRLESMNTDGAYMLTAVFGSLDIYDNTPRKSMTRECLTVSWLFGDAELTCEYFVEPVKFSVQEWATNAVPAAVGQYFRVSAVDEKGNVTAVEAVDAPSGGDNWRKIAGETFDGSEVKELLITEDENGQPFSLKKVMVIYYAPNSTYNALHVSVQCGGASLPMFATSSWGSFKSSPVVGIIDATTHYFTGWMAQTNGYFNQNTMGFLGGTRDPRVLAQDIEGVYLFVIGGNNYFGANCAYEIWGVDA